MRFKKLILPAALIVLLGVSLVYATTFEVKPENLAQTFSMSSSGLQPPYPGYLIVFAYYGVEQPDGVDVGSLVQALVTIMGPESHNGTTTTDLGNPLIFIVTPGEYSVFATYDSAPQQNATVEVTSGGGGDVFLNFGSTSLPTFPPLAYDAVVAGVAPSQTVVGQGYSQNISVYAVDLGAEPVMLNVTVYANTTYVGFQSVTLSSEGALTILIFTWDTTGFAYGNYTISAISAYAWPVSNETNTADSNLTGGNVIVTIPGDINGDGTVDIYDAILLASAFGSTPGSPNWNPNADINGDGVVDIYDAIILSAHYSQLYPNYFHLALGA
jgi:hypothetical protein